MSVTAERAREQLAMMYVSKSQGITAVRLVDEDGEKILVVDILAPFWQKVGGSLPKTWSGLDVCVQLHDAAGGAYPGLIHLRTSAQLPASPFAAEEDPYGGTSANPLGARLTPRYEPQTSQFPSARRGLLALALIVGGLLLAKSGIGWVAAGFLLSGFVLGSGIKARSMVENRTMCILYLLMLAMCAAGTYAFFAVASGVLAWILGANVAFATGQLAGMLLRGWWCVLNEDVV